MRTVDEYLKLPYRLELIPDTDEGGYVASFPELPGCLSQGETMEEAMENAYIAKQAWLTAAIEDGIQVNEPEALNEYSGQFKLRMPKSMHKTLSMKAKEEGVSMNQYCVYLLSKSIGNSITATTGR